MKRISKLLAVVALVLPLGVFASESCPKLETAPDNTRDLGSLQNGAKLFVNYCLNCHSASYVRYNKLRDLGITEQQIKDNLLFTGEKTGDLMKIAMRREDAKVWFGAAPPDLTVIARSRSSECGTGPDWLYTYLRSFYRDEKRPTGWNNVVFENVGMPHVLYELQGEQVAHVEEKDDGHGGKHKEVHLELSKPGKMSKDEYDRNVADLVSFLAWMGEPAADLRKQIGIGVLAVLSVLFVLAYLLKKNYWKDVH